jgi:hypothetical protein
MRTARLLGRFLLVLGLVGCLTERSYAQWHCQCDGAEWAREDACTAAGGSWVCEEESDPGLPYQDAEIRAFSGREEFLAALTAEVARLQLLDVQVHRGASDEVVGLTFEKQSDLEEALRGLVGEAEQPLETTTHLLSAGDDPENDPKTWPNPLVPPEIERLLKIGSTIIGGYGNVTSAFEGLRKVANLLAGIDVPSELDIQFDKLRKHMDQIGFEIMDLDAKHAQAERNAKAKAASSEAKQALLEPPGWLRNELLSHAYNNSELAVTAALEEAAFLRKIKGKEGLSYDWRVGVPHLIWAVGVRLQVLKIVDELEPLVVDGVRMPFPRRYRDRLLELRDGLYGHYKRVTDGVEYFWRTSKWHDDFVVRDKHTNIEFIAQDATHDPKKREIRIDQMFTMLPVFELQAALDALEATLMSGDIPGFVDFGLYGRLVVDAAPDLCLQSNHYSYWKNATIEQCKYDIGSGNQLYWQSFEYDRAKGQMKDYFGHCLAIDNHPYWGAGLVVSVACGTKNYYDKWSWDPWNHVFRNKMGRNRVLDIRFGVLAPGSSVITWPVHFGDNQRFSYGTITR